jgi:group I intron endonuclease
MAKKKVGDVWCFGIYKITNIKNGKFYIGSTIVKFKWRWSHHKCELRTNRHKNIHLQRSYHKHGLSAFEFSIVEICEDKNIVIEREQYYIDTLNPAYNISRIASRPSPYIQTEEQRRATSERFKGKPSWNDGIPFDEEVRQRMSESMKGRKAPNKGKKGISDRSIIRSDGKTYKNIYEAAIELNVKENTIVKAITDKKIIRTVRGFNFKYLIDNIEPLHKNITKSGRKWKVIIKKHYYGTFETLELAKEFRDSILKNNVAKENNIE